MKPVISVVLLFLGASALMGGTYSLVSSFVFWRPGAWGVLPVALIVAMGVGLVFAASKFWDRWAIALAAILILVGLGSLQTRPGSDDPTHGGGQRAFQITGGILAAAGVATYLIARRRGS